MNKEYIVVKDAETGDLVGRVEVKSKIRIENYPAYVVNGSLLFGVAEFDYMQKVAEDLIDFNCESEDE